MSKPHYKSGNVRHTFTSKHFQQARFIVNATQRQNLQALGVPARSRAVGLSRKSAEPQARLRALGLPSLTRFLWPQTRPCCLGALPLGARQEQNSDFRGINGCLPIARKRATGSPHLFHVPNFLLDACTPRSRRGPRLHQPMQPKANKERKHHDDLHRHAPHVIGMRQPARQSRFRLPLSELLKWRLAWIILFDLRVERVGRFQVDSYSPEYGSDNTCEQQQNNKRHSIAHHQTNKIEHLCHSTIPFSCRISHISEP
jgi:hypothetical protein